MRRWFAATSRALVDALLGDPHAAVVLLDADGQVIRGGAGADRLCGGDLLLAAPAAGDVRDAVRAANPYAGVGEILAASGAIPVALSLVPTGLKKPAAVLRLLDLRAERALQAQLDQAQRLQAVGELAGGIAHDFNNLLTAISGAAEDLGPHIDLAGQEDLAQIRTSAARGASLVRQLLAFGGQQTLQPRVLALNDAVRDAAALIGRLLGRNITLRVELEEPSRLVKVDPTQLDQVLVNLA
ncbi:MAG TPA: hybrid sensor histidine kinase/response regulator, partial [Acetobacteraceae bacterium]|nr:hybrid sensor histidine kinase/response regulator [Acetobacteraceae bacterium]